MRSIIQIMSDITYNFFYALTSSNHQSSDQDYSFYDLNGCPIVTGPGY